MSKWTNSCIEDAMKKPKPMNTSVKFIFDNSQITDSFQPEIKKSQELESQKLMKETSSTKEINVKIQNYTKRKDLNKLGKLKNIAKLNVKPSNNRRKYRIRNFQMILFSKLVQ